MPTTPYAELRVRVNGGAPQTGAVTFAAGDTIALDAASYDGWASPVARWEWYSFPEGWTGPGGDWSSETVTQSDGSEATVYYWLGNSAPPSFTAPAAELWGKYLPRLLVNGGYKGGSPSTDVEDRSTALEMLSAGGLHDLAWLENTQFGNAKKWTKDHQANLRVIDTALASVAAPYVLTPALVVFGAGSAGFSPQYAKGDHSHELTFDTTNAVLAAATAAIDVNGQTLTSGGFIGPYFATSAANPATSGLLRGAHGTTLVASRDSGNTDNVPLVSFGTGTNDVLVLGDPVIPCMQLVIASGCDFEFYSDAQLLYTLAQGSISVGAGNGFYLTHATGAGAGATGTIQAQGGAAGFAGGLLSLCAGVPGAGGAPTGVDLELQASATVSGTLSAKGGAFGSLMTVQYVVATGFTTLGIGSPDDRAMIETKELVFKAENATLFGTTVGTYGGGTGVLYMPSATTAPTTDITTGIGVYASSDALRARNHALTVLAPDIENAPGNEDLRAPDRRASRVTTTDGVQTTAYTYAMPDNSVALFEVEVLAFGPAAGTSAVYKIRAGVKRFGGGATLIGTVDVFEREDNAALDATLDVNSNDVRIRVTGIEALTFEWFVTPNVTLMQP